MQAQQNRRMTISLVMPNRNHGIYLPHSIGGMLAQMRPADEIIIIDDASTDDSVAIIERFAANHSSIRLIRRSERAGVIANLNLGLHEAKSDLIAFPGADDLIFPAFLEETGRLMEQFSQASFAAGCAEIWNGANQVTGLRPAIMPTMRSAYVNADGYRAKLTGADNFFLGATTLYRRATLLEIGGFDEALGSTTDGMAARRLAARHGFCFCPLPLGMWRIHGSNYSVSMATSRTDFMRMTQRIEDVLRAEPEGIFPPDYPKRLVRRLKFGVGRLMILEPGSDQESRGRLCELTGGSFVDRIVINLGARLGALGRYGAIVWLTLRLSPFSLWRLAIEPLRRLLSRRLVRHYRAS